MANANVLSILLNFKPDLSGLSKFTGFIEDRMKRVQAYNSAMKNGTAAINSALQAGAAFFAAGKLKEYSREATEAARAQGQLEQALVRTRQNSAQYRAELAAQAEAQQNLTGVDDDYIKTIQRELIFNKARRADIAELTSLTLDFAAAKNLDAGAAAKLVGKSLTGDEEDLKRYGVELGKSADRVTALKEGLRAFRGQASQAFAALPEDMRRFQIASNDASKSAGALINQIASPFLSGLADGLGRTNERLREMRENGSGVVTFLRQMSAAAGDLIGRNLDKIMIVVGGLLLLKGANYAVTQSMIMLGSTFVLITGQAFLPMMSAVQALSKEVGILRAISAGGWAAALGTSLVAIGAALAAFTVGLVAINQLEAAAMESIEHQETIRTKLGDQTKELQRQVAEVKTLAEVRAVQAAAEARIATDKARIAQLEAKARAPGGRGLKLSEDERNELDQLKRRAGINDSLLRTAKDDVKIKERLAANNKPAADQSKADIDLAFSLAEARRKELAAQIESGNRIFLENQERDKKLRLAEETFALETQATQAEAAGNTRLAEQIRDQIKQKQYEQELAGGDITLAQKRVEAERAVTEEQRRRQIAEQEFSRQIAENDMARQLIDQDYYLTDEEKNLAKIRLLQDSNRLIKERIALLEHEQALNPDPSRQQTIDGLRQQRGDNSAEMLQLTPLTPQQGFLAGVVDFLSQIPTLAERARSSISSIGSALQGGLASSIEGLIKRTMTWRDALLNVATSVVNALISSFAGMVADWMVRQVMMMVFGKALAAAQLAAMVPIAMAASAIWAVPATLATIATMGAAAVAAPIAIAAANMSTTAMSMIPGLATGGIVRGAGTGTSDSNLRRLSNGEAVLNASATSFVGEDVVHALNAGARDLDSLSGSIAGQMPRDMAYGGGGGGGGFDAAGLVDALAKKISLQAIVVPDERAARRIERRGQAADDVVSIVRTRRSEIFRQGPT